MPSTVVDKKQEYPWLDLSLFRGKLLSFLTEAMFSDLSNLEFSRKLEVSEKTPSLCDFLYCLVG